MGSGQSKKFKELEGMAQNLNKYQFKYEGGNIIPSSYDEGYEEYNNRIKNFIKDINNINEFVEQSKLMPIMQNMRDNRTLAQTLPHYHDNVVMASNKRSLEKHQYTKLKEESESSNLKNKQAWTIRAFNGGEYKKDNLEEAITEDNGRKRSSDAVGIIRKYLEDRKSEGKVPTLVKTQDSPVASQQAEINGFISDKPPYYKIHYVDSPDVERKKIDDKIQYCKAYIEEHKEGLREGLQGGKRRRRHKNTKRRHKKAKKTRRR
jgi:hypothetical protein